MENEHYMQDILSIQMHVLSVLAFTRKKEDITSLFFFTLIFVSRHSFSASLVPADSPKRSGKLNKTQVGLI